MFLIIIAIIVIVLILIYPYIKGNNTQKQKNIPQIVKQDITSKQPYNERPPINYKKYYKAKRYIITLNELKFYNVLLEIAKELDLILFAQVSLYNIIKMQDDLDFRTETIFFNKIAAKTIDFVLVDKTNCRIKLCIELDDSTHRKKKRIQRDEFINDLFKNLDINLLRYPVYPVCYKETLKKQIQNHMQEHYYVD